LDLDLHVTERSKLKPDGGDPRLVDLDELVDRH